MAWTLSRTSGQERPALVIAPPALDPEVAGRVTFASKAEPPDEADRGVIAGLYVGFHTVKTESMEGIAHHQRQSLGHEPAPLVRPEHVVAEIAAPQGPPDDLADIRDADELIRIAQADEIALVSRPPQPTHVGAVGGGGRGCLDPPAVEPSTPAHRRHELGGPSRRWPHERDARTAHHSPG